MGMDAPGARESVICVTGANQGLVWPIGPLHRYTGLWGVHVNKDLVYVETSSGAQCRL